MYMNDPQRKIDKKAEELYADALGCIERKEYDQAFATLDQIDVYWSDYSKVAGKRAEAVKKQQMERLETYRQAGDYGAVISYMDEHIEDKDSDEEMKAIYADSVQQYKEETLKKADESVTAGDYAAALSFLATAEKVIGEDETLEAKENEVKKAEIVHGMEEFKNTGDLAGEIKYINENMDQIGTDSEILLELSNCENSFRGQIVTEAKAAYDTGGYEAALEKVNYGLSVLNNDDSLLKEKEKYSALAPVYLMDLSPYVGELWSDENVSDNMGNTYARSFCTCVNESATYDLGGKYTVFKGTVAVTKADEDREMGSIKIIGDGRVLKEISLSASTKPAKISVDITGISDLEVVMEVVSGNVILANAYLQGTL